MIAQNFDRDMDMVRHEAPCQQPITVAVEMEECVLNQHSDLGAPQPASA
jgi:hypothetical protein